MACQRQPSHCAVLPTAATLVALLASALLTTAAAVGSGTAPALKQCCLNQRADTAMQEVHQQQQRSQRWQALGLSTEEDSLSSAAMLEALDRRHQLTGHPDSAADGFADALQSAAVPPAGSQAERGPGHPCPMQPQHRETAAQPPEEPLSHRSAVEGALPCQPCSGSHQFHRCTAEA